MTWRPKVLNVSSDLHEVKRTCADSKQASKESQWIVYSSCSATSMTFALPHWNNFSPARELMHQRDDDHPHTLSSVQFVVNVLYCVLPSAKEAVAQSGCLGRLIRTHVNVSSDLRESEQVILSAHTRCRHTTYELALLSIIL